ncbi:sugar ABC transporter substrate-binding protein [Kribbella sp. NPDC050124]|uniref:sugar ABC transporter substrate-binding protein n=1 Tax=Kribbella sp. NPDC050124 TaxID=3364114 RepID=UPI00379A2CC3
MRFTSPRFARAGVAATAALATVSLAACGSDSPAASGTASGDSLDGKIVARVAPAVQQVESVLQGIAKETLAEKGVKFQVANADGDPAKQRSLTEQYIAQGVNALMLTNVDMSGWESTFKDATDKGIAVVNMSGSPISGASVNFNQDQSGPGFEVGKFVGNWLKEKHACQGSVGFMTTVTIPAFQPRTKNAQTQIHQICPEVKFVDPVDAYTPEMGAKAGGNLIQSHPELDAIVSVNDDAAVGAFQAIKEAGKTDPNKFLLTGYDATPEGQKLLEQHTVFQLSWSYAIPYWAAQGARFAMDAIAKKDVPPTARVFGAPVTADNLAEYRKWADAPLDPANQDRFAKLIQTSTVKLSSGDAIGKAFQ